MNCKETILTILDTFIENGELKYADYEEIIIQTLYNFGNGTVFTLIKKLEEFQQKEQQMEKKLNNEIQ